MLIIIAKMTNIRKQIEGKFEIYLPFEDRILLLTDSQFETV